MFKSSVVVVMAFVLGTAMAQMRCPPGVCDTIECPVDVAFGCTDGKVVQNGGYCGCCTVCVKQLAEGESCTQTLITDVPKTVECSDGLLCDYETHTCKKTLNPCHQEIANKEQVSEAAGGQLMGLTMPTCTDDGFYTPKQCVEAVCQCVKSDGTPIQSYQVNIGQSAEMGCQCARDQAELEEGAHAVHGRFSPQCDALGNYRKRQCRESVCNCVDRNGQAIEGFQAHVSQAPKMSCDCARRNSDMILTGENHIPYKCDELGNFITI